MIDEQKTDVDDKPERYEEVEEKLNTRKPSKLKLIIFIFSLLVIMSLVVLASRSANPNNKPLYNVKRLYEKTQLSLKSTPVARLNYLYSLLDKRLAELNFIVENGESLYVLPTASRYSPSRVTLVPSVRAWLRPRTAF